MTFPEVKQFSTEIGGKKVVVEIGRLANQADASCTVRCGDTVVMATCTMSKNPPREGVNFLPLMVNYQEKYFAGGMIKSSRFIKRETRPADDKILMARVIDRSLRPLFQKNLRNDIQVMIYTLSYDKENMHDSLGALAASLVVHLSPAPFAGPIASVRVGQVDGNFVLNPTEEQNAASDLSLIVSATKDGVVMIEAGAKEISEETILEGIQAGQDECVKLCTFFDEIRSAVGKEKMELALPDTDEELEQFIIDNYSEAIEKCVFEIEGKLERFAKKRALTIEAKEKALEHFGEERDISLCGELFNKVFKGKIRDSILNDEHRIARRALTQVRPIKSEVSVLPRTHGSAIFTRGETQGLTTVTMGGPSNALLTEGIEGEKKHHFFHYYNFPPFSVGECSNRLFTGNREIGHGALAQKALTAVMPDQADFPYVIHANTEILSSNGSSSMAATCGLTLALMDAGVPIKSPVSGIAMGLMTGENGNFKILSDIQDEEDAGGDMDFKVAGTAKGITAIQMDIKVDGISMEIFKECLEQAKGGRAKILEAMLSAIDAPRAEMSQFAPRLITMHISPEKIRTVIGKGGETINKIIDQTGCEVDIEQDGTIVIASVDGEMGKKAQDWILDLTFEPTVGDIYDAEVVRIEDYGAFVDFKGNNSGLVHISLIAKERIDKVDDVLKIGQKVKVKLLEVDNMGRMRLSIKDAPQS